VLAEEISDFGDEVEAGDFTFASVEVVRHSGNNHYRSREPCIAHIPVGVEEHAERVKSELFGLTATISLKSKSAVKEMNVGRQIYEDEVRESRLGVDSGETESY
jgi:hypothetical protein